MAYNTSHISKLNAPFVHFKWLPLATERTVKGAEYQEVIIIWEVLAWHYRFDTDNSFLSDNVTYLIQGPLITQVASRHARARKTPRLRLYKASTTNLGHHFLSKMAPTSCSALNAAITRTGLSYAQIATQVGVPEQRVVEIVTGKATATNEEFANLSRALGITQSAPHDSAHVTK
ncbi:hypothetical protein SERLA73DRAFT_188428 [Serpula lacrymans var. lacrymans S7.3]|uniref:HTH cro/C1-type domain-containing protein n=2 Tax=Serpula lacrymans var. lacrymans TaxID=341189 RepID=F8QBA8_SERL3|nr:uncharacterized protein SERLADRAFT_478529 [Serpula lacrymans var. lacrymans S7.9]EGN94494.1 hypothetical protein SERLA73DRAFT_188428 [Serpula lacrymans var. lacrymans S7.3]EGO19971.1 hypothetical protein SERLADRAFT_478529 [Serpula lacrymans var. lacrymans S7.9]